MNLAFKKEGETMRNFRRGMLLNFILVFTFMALIGCSTLLMTSPNSVCSQIPEGQNSTICDVANSVGLSPETVASVIEVGNLTALVTDVYTATQAMVFVNKVDDFLYTAQQTGLTYAAVLEAAKKEYGELTPKVKAVFIILTDFADIPQNQMDKLLTDYDYTILHKGLRRQKLIIQPFLPAAANNTSGPFHLIL